MLNYFLLGKFFTTTNPPPGLNLRFPSHLENVLESFVLLEKTHFRTSVHLPPEGLSVTVLGGARGPEVGVVRVERIESSVFTVCEDAVGHVIQDVTKIFSAQLRELKPARVRGCGHPVVDLPDLCLV